MSIGAKATYGESQPLSALSRLAEIRAKELGTSLKKALTAAAVTLMRSLRAATAVAKPDKLKLEEAPGLRVSFASRGKEAPRPCIRYTGSSARFVPQPGERVRYAPSTLGGSTHARVWSVEMGYGEKKARYYIAALSASDARRYAKELQKRRMNAYKGLARLAWGTLMYKTATSGGAASQGTMKARSTALKQTRVTRTSDASITLEDNLDYALDAMKGGMPGLERAAQKAANSVASALNRALEARGLAGRVDIPFPK